MLISDKTALTRYGNGYEAGTQKFSDPNIGEKNVIWKKKWFVRQNF